MRDGGVSRLTRERTPLSNSRLPSNASRVTPGSCFTETRFMGRPEPTRNRSSAITRADGPLERLAAANGLETERGEAGDSDRQHAVGVLGMHADADLLRQQRIQAAPGRRLVAEHPADAEAPP